jgi:excinuclease UvrABC nuclease subunit
MSDKTSEIETLAAFIEIRLGDIQAPDLIVVDGGKAHLAAAMRAVDSIEADSHVIAAVKPAGRHSEISHFLTANGDRIEYSKDDQAMQVLKILRDTAHDLANYVHREMRDARHFYEASGTLPLVVPTSFVDRNGAADDLRPIVTDVGPGERG